MTTGIDGQIIDVVSKERIDIIILLLKIYTYQLNPACREYIEKKH
jgi:hypothetical protein